MYELTEIDKMLNKTDELIIFAITIYGAVAIPKLTQVVLEPDEHMSLTPSTLLSLVPPWDGSGNSPIDGMSLGYHIEGKNPFLL